jgi:hypothetical protein
MTEEIGRTPDGSPTARAHTRPTEANDRVALDKEDDNGCACERNDALRRADR